jgi:WD40 repeat protein
VPAVQQSTSACKRWSAAGGIEVLPHSHDVLAVAFRPDGKQLACATLDGQLHLWDPLEGELQVLLSVLRCPVQPLLCVHTYATTAVCRLWLLPRHSLGIVSQSVNYLAYSQMQHLASSCLDILTRQSY